MPRSQLKRCSRCNQWRNPGLLMGDIWKGPRCPGGAGICPPCQTKLTAAYRKMYAAWIEDVEWMIETGEVMWMIARRLDISLATLEMRLRRVGRHDLYVVMREREKAA